MPFARQHHDFREGNILGENPQVIIDWGSSYGHGPFLYDLAPFLLNHQENLAIFIQHSDICKQAGRTAIKRWLYVAACARFMTFFTYIRERADCEKVKDLEAFLEYHYQTYGSLLQ
jgi:aminoglycoside phosphotransferase (APT) family kinase protein